MGKPQGILCNHCGVVIARIKNTTRVGTCRNCKDKKGGLRAGNRKRNSDKRDCD